MEHQREVHSEERALWHAERQELHEKITQLEASLRRYQAASSSQVASPIDKPARGSGSSGSLTNMDRSRDTSTSGTGDEVWRGPKMDVQPTRTFSDSFSQSAKSDGRLPSIAEDVTSQHKGGMRGWITSPDRRRSREVSREIQGSGQKPSVEIDKNLDGINFRSSSLSLASAKNIMTPPSPSPQSPSPSHNSSGPMQLPLSGLGVPGDQYTRDAGHTPLARRTYFQCDGASSTRSSNPTTPVQIETERPLLEPQTSRVRLPSERSDSYFPAAEHTASDIDHGLVGPLGLTNEKSEDNQFLNELDSKLEAAASQNLEPSAVAGASESGSAEGGDEKDVVHPEHEPKLKIKRSMNFGSAFGAKHCGRGV